MRRTSLFFIILLGIVLGLYSGALAAPLEIPGGDLIKEHSIVDANGDAIRSGDIIILGQSFGWRILSLMKIIVSGFALVFMVMIGAYMIVFSDSEEEIKKQKKQILYTLIGFLFLNIPGLVYKVLSPENAAGNKISIINWTETTGGVVWYTMNLPGFIGDIVAFLRVFAYGSAILMLTWGFFRLILSAGDEEQLKIARHRILYSILALMFLLFIEVWIRTIVTGNLTVALPGVMGTILKLALFFVAPVGVFFIIYGAYYFITSAGNEERVKKGKTILWNTFIASIILIAAFTFLTDIANITL